MSATHIIHHISLIHTTSNKKSHTSETETMSTQSKPTDNEVSIAEYLSTFQREYGAAYNRFELAKENGNDQLASELKDKMFGMEREHIHELEHRLAEALSGDDNELKLLLTDSLFHYWERKAATSLPTQPILLRLLARGNREPTLEEENLAHALEERFRESQEDTQELAAMYASTRNEVESNRKRIKQLTDQVQDQGEAINFLVDVARRNGHHMPDGLRQRAMLPAGDQAVTAEDDEQSL